MLAVMVLLHIATGQHQRWERYCRTTAQHRFRILIKSWERPASCKKRPNITNHKNNYRTSCSENSCVQTLYKLSVNILRKYSHWHIVIGVKVLYSCICAGLQFAALEGHGATVNSVQNLPLHYKEERQKGQGRSIFIYSSVEGRSRMGRCQELYSFLRELWTKRIDRIEGTWRLIAA